MSKPNGSSNVGTILDGLSLHRDWVRAMDTLDRVG